MVNKSTKPWPLECPRAFQTDPSWYEAYWYREPEPRRPNLISRSIATLTAAFQRLTVLSGRFAKTIRTGGAVWASRAIKEKQSQWWYAAPKAQIRCQGAVTARPRIAKAGV